jgi:hypothetical protein
VAAQLVASQVVLSSTELVKVHVSFFSLPLLNAFPLLEFICTQGVGPIKYLHSPSELT